MRRNWTQWLGTIAVAGAVACSRQQQDLDFAAQREALVREFIAARGIQDPQVLSAMRKVPRHKFVPAAVVAAAYSDRPLSIGYGQTISQPYVVALMTELAHTGAHERCLEVGTGSGYQAAVLAEICKVVYSMEYIPELAKFAEGNLRKLGYGPDRVQLRTGDGYAGWPAAAPFDAIIVTAAPDRVPAPLLEQLAVGGALVIPVGPAGGVQVLERWTRSRVGTGAGAFQHEAVSPVRFVPLLGH
ncbi:MAG TPA: protein-L-isoaspartate(D-aspartate) O-methyltransferase [Polyangiaceae bacterium]